MAPRESQKKASLKWDKENMTVLSCKMKKIQAVAFKTYCENQGSTSNTVLKDFVLGCIGEQNPVTSSTSPQDTGGQPSEVGGISLSPQILKTAQRAAQNAGETVPQFVERAIETQAKRDEVSLRVGLVQQCINNKVIT